MGFLVLRPIYFMEGKIGRDTPPAITRPEYFYGFVGAGLAWQVWNLGLSTDPVRYRAMLPPSILEKVTRRIARIGLFSQHRLPGLVFFLLTSQRVHHDQAQARLRLIQIRFIIVGIAIKSYYRKSCPDRIEFALESV